jgi:3-(3-hydroxy-phenyl)propionate hydroxylase
VRCLFSREVEAFSQNSDGVTLNVKGSDGERETVRADWLVACDGGASFIRRAEYSLRRQNRAESMDCY